MRSQIFRVTILLSLLLALLGSGCQQNAPTSVTPSSSSSSSASSTSATSNGSSNTDNVDKQSKGKGIEDISFKDVSGREYKYKDLQGKVVLIVYWATWCPPCRSEIPTLNQLQEKYSPRGAMILAVSQDQEFDTLKNFLTLSELGKSIKYPVVYGAPYFNIFKRKNALPTVMLLNRKGKIVGEQEGAMPMEVLSQAIEEYL